MATLNGQQINQTYEGLIKTANNQAGAPFPPANLQYGDGTDLPIQIGDGTSIGVGDILVLGSPTRNVDINANNLGINGLTAIDASGGTATIINGTFEFGLGFPGAPVTNVDFTNATVTGLPGGAAGLENGTGTDSLQSAASLTTLAANAAGARSIALGDDADAQADETIALGDGATATSGLNIAIGDNANASGANNFARGNIAIGPGTTASDERCVAIGKDAVSSAARGVAIGEAALASGGSAVSIGDNADSTSSSTVAIGNRAIANQSGGVAIGHQAGYLTGTGTNSVCVGKFSGFANGNTATMVGYSATGKAEDSVCIGYNARVESTSSIGMIAIGEQANGVATSDAGPGAIVIGQNAQIDGSGGTVTITNGIALGKDTIVSAAGAVAIGGGVTASVADYTTTKNLQLTNYAALNFADDSAAATGGVPLGGLYHNSGALRIRIV